MAACPTCGRDLTWIPQYERFYCYSEKKYAPKGYGAPPVSGSPITLGQPAGASHVGHFHCPSCGGELTFIPQYDRYYCYAEKTYAPRDVQAVAIATIVGTPVEPIAASPPVEVVSPLIEQAAAVRPEAAVPSAASVEERPVPSSPTASDAIKVDMERAPPTEPVAPPSSVLPSSSELPAGFAEPASAEPTPLEAREGQERRPALSRSRVRIAKKPQLEVWSKAYGLNTKGTRESLRNRLLQYMDEINMPDRDEVKLVEAPIPTGSEEAPASVSQPVEAKSDPATGAPQPVLPSPAVLPELQPQPVQESLPAEPVTPTGPPPTEAPVPTAAEPVRPWERVAEAPLIKESPPDLGLAEPMRMSEPPAIPTLDRPPSTQEPVRSTEGDRPPSMSEREQRPTPSERAPIVGAYSRENETPSRPVETETLPQGAQAPSPVVAPPEPRPEPAPWAEPSPRSTLPETSGLPTPVPAPALDRPPEVRAEPVPSAARPQIPIAREPVGMTQRAAPSSGAMQTPPAIPRAAPVPPRTAEPPVTRVEVAKALPCPNCGRELTYISRYDRLYCFSCGRYAPKGYGRERVEAVATRPAPAVAAPMQAMAPTQTFAPTPVPTRPAEPPRAVEVRPENVCPSCGRTMRFIKEYGRWWCDAEKKYAPKRVKNPCPTCGKELSYVRTYDRWYCSFEKRYAPKSYQASAPVTIERTAPQVSAPTTTSAVAAQTKLAQAAAAVETTVQAAAAVPTHLHGKPNIGIALAVAGFSLFIVQILLFADPDLGLIPGRGDNDTTNLDEFLLIPALALVAAGTALGLYAVRGRPK